MTVGAYLREAKLATALDQIDDVVADSMRARATPGIALAITDRERLLATRTYGFANLEAKTPVTNETLFEFGSIGKSFTAICILQLMEEGVLDLHAPVTTYLPWFSVRSAYDPITIHHLLTHTSGLICGSDFTPDQRFEVWSLRETDAAPPGQKARYSNVGYKLLGLVLEAVTGKPYAQLVRERIFTPLGMTDSATAITNDLRRRLAVGYTEFFDDRPWRPAHGFVPAPWLETNTADGCLSANAADLVTFLRMVLNRGVGRLISDASFALMTASHTELGDGEAYGYGIDVADKNERKRIGHGGGMVGYISSLVGDPEAGIGVAVFTNAMQSTDAIAEFALQTVVNALAGVPLPVPDAPPIVALDAYEGVFRSGAVSLTVMAEGGQLFLGREDERIPLKPTGFPPTPDTFLADHPDFARFPIRFSRDAQGAVVELIHGGDWYTTEHYDGPTSFATPPEWQAYPGHYRNYNPWSGNFRVVLRKGVLHIVYPHGQEHTLTLLGTGFRIGDDPESPERIAFDTIVDGQALRAIRPGGEVHYRFFTP
jgi:CubicO group peptidase (beta-lactamase class C family)